VRNHEQSSDRLKVPRGYIPSWIIVSDLKSRCVSEIGAQKGHHLFHTNREIKAKEFFPILELI